MSSFFDICQRLSLLRSFRDISLLLFVSQLVFHVSLYHVEAASIQNISTPPTITIYDIESLADYKKLFKALKHREDAEKLQFRLRSLKCDHELLHFLGILTCTQNIFEQGCRFNSFSKNSKKKSFADVKNDENSALRSSFHFESSEDVREELGKVKISKILIGSDLEKLLKDTVRKYAAKDICLLFTAIYRRFSYKAQADICEQIKVQFPDSIFLQSLREEQHETFSCNEQLEEANIFENEVKLMESLMMTLFMERINDVFIKKLPKEFTTLKVFFFPKIPLLLNFVSLEHFSCLENIQLYGDYFETISQSQIKPLSTAPIQTMDLRNLNLIKSFFEFLLCYSKEKGIDFKSKDYVSSASDIEIFKKLTSLNLAVPLSTDMHQQIELIKLLPSLKTIKIKGTLEELQPILQLLKDFADSSSLDIITVKLYVCNHCMTYKVIDIKRNADGNSFNALDFNLSHLKSENNQRNEIEKAVEILNE